MAHDQPFEELEDDPLIPVRELLDALQALHESLLGAASRLGCFAVQEDLVGGSPQGLRDPDHLVNRHAASAALDGGEIGLGHVEPSGELDLGQALLLAQQPDAGPDLRLGDDELVWFLRHDTP